MGSFRDRVKANNRLTNAFRLENGSRIIEQTEEWNDDTKILQEA